jgi:CheY-like chemotaxis protein
MAKTILVVDDDKKIVSVVRGYLEQAGFEVQVAYDGHQALATFRHQRPNLILLDLNLPKYDGRQLLERVKSDPDLARIPIVVLTTSSAEEDIVRSYKLHANAYVSKPVDLDQFISAVRQIDDFFLEVVRLPGVDQT